MPYKEYHAEKLYYTIGEVAEILGESTSLVRFWSDTFSAFIHPERNSKGNRKFTPSDVENLKMIHYLVKERRMTLEGAAERMRVNKEGINKNIKVIESLNNIKTTLLEISDSLN